MAAVAEVEARLGPTDLLVANAGVGAPTLVSPMNVTDVEKMYRVNVFGVLYSIEAVLPGMLARKKGHLAAVSSMAAYKGLPGESGYSSSKAAVNNLMEGLRIQLRDKGVAVTTICPGFVKTPMTDVNDFHMPWLIGADDAARRIVRALRRRKKVFNFPWQMMLLMRLTRWLPDGVMARQMQQYNEKPPFPKTPL
jgi:short-subunit dehydrogenase